MLHKTTYRHKLVDTSLCELQSLFYIPKCLAAPDYHTVDAGGATSGYNGKQILDRFLMIMANMSPSLSYSSSNSYKESNIWIRSSIQRTSCTTFNALPSLHHQKTHKMVNIRIARPRNALLRAILRRAILSTSFIRIARPIYFVCLC